MTHKVTGTKKILVPTDFTKVVDYAMDHAAILVHLHGCEPDMASDFLHDVEIRDAVEGHIGRGLSDLAR